MQSDNPIIDQKPSKNINEFAEIDGSEYFERNPSAHHHILLQRDGRAVLLTRRGTTFDRERVRIFVAGVEA